MTSFAICYIHREEVSASFLYSLADVVEYDRLTRQRMVVGGVIRVGCPSGALSYARNSAVRAFLNLKSRPEYLCWFDTDMGFPHTIVDQLLESAHPTERPIVGALCFMPIETHKDGMGGGRFQPVPTIFDYVEDDGKRHLRTRRTYPVNELVRCDGTGSAAVVVHRSVFERIRKASGDIWYDPLYNETTNDYSSEDLSFCMRSDVPIHVDTRAKTTHMKPMWLQEQDYWQAFVAPPAEHETAVIVPVMRRPLNAGPFMKSLRASTGLATVYPVADAEDVQTITAWTVAGANVLISDRGHTFAQKVNYGYEHTDEPYLFFVGDDVRFYPGWLDHAQHVAITYDKGFVGTNDMGNTSVMAGVHATHPLMSRHYIDEHGASWDGPKVVAHEGYRHNFVDNEWAEVARQHGQYGFALGSKVEHLHPNWSKGQSDEVYRKGQSNWDRDKALVERRFKRFAA